VLRKGLAVFIVVVKHRSLGSNFKLVGAAFAGLGDTFRVSQNSSCLVFRSFAGILGGVNKGLSFGKGEMIWASK
jgi:hypothetical protein